MLEIIGHYWLEFILGVIATGLTIACKKIYKLYKNEKNHQKTEEQKEFYESLQDCIKEASKVSREEEKKLLQMIAETSEKSRQEEKHIQDQINAITAGVLSIQGRQFKEECRGLLKPSNNFSVEEYETLLGEYEVYHQLGGNGDGTQLMKLVEKKAGVILTDDKE